MIKHANTSLFFSFLGVEVEDVVAEGVEEKIEAEVMITMVEDVIDIIVCNVVEIVDRSLSCDEVPYTNAVDICAVMIINEYRSTEADNTKSLACLLIEIQQSYLTFVFKYR